MIAEEECALKGKPSRPMLRIGAVVWVYFAASERASVPFCRLIDVISDLDYWTDFRATGLSKAQAHMDRRHETFPLA